MKRREFIRNTGAFVAAAGLLPSMGFRNAASMKYPELIDSFILKGFDGEQEEYPSIVSDGEDMWMYALRRMKYPEDRELISAFHFNGNEWEEMSSVTKEAGLYEAPFAACAHGGKPVVAWSSIELGEWVINVAQMKGKGFSKSVQLRPSSGRPINPVLFAASKDRNWIAWENYEHGKFSIRVSKGEKDDWSEQVVIQREGESCFSPAMAEDASGNLFLIYVVTSGVHQNVEMVKIDGDSLEQVEHVEVAIGGKFKDRNNRNTNPAIAFDKDQRLWISYENNRNVHRLDDSDCFTGDRYCSILSYEAGEIVEPLRPGKWLFQGKNDHKPTFFKNAEGHLFLATHCGGDFEGKPYWKYRLSWLDPRDGWVKPQTMLETKQKGALIPPAMAFGKDNKIWLSTCIEKQFKQRKADIVLSHLTQLSAFSFSTPILNNGAHPHEFKKTVVVENSPDVSTQFIVSGHPKISGEKIVHKGEEYTLLYGNLHEHSENSPCWPAGTDGTLHEDYRFGMHSEAYDFVSMTDHGYSMTEVYWRKNIRLVDFYHDPPYFIALPGMEWTLSAARKLEEVPGAGHYNVIFKDADAARSFVRNQDEIFSRDTPETNRPDRLWKVLDDREIDCITIPHHPADEVHAVDWHIYNSKYVPVVELFQCRGNSEYPGCPREINLDRHRTTPSKRAFVDYALREMKHKMGFVASGDHNSMGIGVAGLWVKEVSREGIMEAMRSKHCFGTTGDKIIVDFRVDEALAGSTIGVSGIPKLKIRVKGQRALYKIEVLRNSRVIQEFYTDRKQLEFRKEIEDKAYTDEQDVLYYYVRVTQQNNDIAWSSPVWLEA